MKFYVSGMMTISIGCVVEADNADAAREQAEQADINSFCHQCAKGASKDHMDVWCTSGELDGEPQVTDVEKL